jgi:hypothetical protein
MEFLWQKEPFSADAKYPLAGIVAGADFLTKK